MISSSLATTAPRDAQRPTALDTILFGGLAIGVLDFLDATIFFGLHRSAVSKSLARCGVRASRR